MKTPPGESVFDKMHIEYETLRKQDHPIRTIIKYFRKEVKKNDNGEDLWWLETESNDIPIQTVYVRLWGNLTKQEKEQFRIQAMALFPEIFGNDAKKYAKLAVWLAGTHGIVAPSLRDAFTAGGQVSLTVDGKTIPDVPKIFKHLQDDLPMVITTINTLDDAKIEYYWGKKVPQSQRIKEWTKMVNENALRSLGDCNLDVEKLIHM